MSKPKLALIPSGYKSGKVYSILPNDATGDFDFERQSIGTRVRKDGLIEEVTDNVPRLDWLNSNCPSLLLEPQRSNILKRSEQFDNATWSKNNSSINSNSIISPNGTLTADKFIEDNTTNTHRLNQIFFSASNDTYTFSVFVKKNGRSNFHLSISDSATGQANILVDLDNGTFTNGVKPTGSWTNVSGGIEELASGWYRVHVTGDKNAGSNIIADLELYNNARNYTGDGISGIYVWGAMLEQASYPTSYIKTEASAVTRLKDECYGGGTADFFNDNEGVLFLNMKSFVNGGTNRFIQIHDGSYNNAITLYFTSTTNRIVARVWAGGSSVLTLNYTVDDVTQYHKYAFKYKSGDYQLWVDGTKVLTNSLTTTPTGLNQIGFLQGTAGNDFFGKVKDLRYFDNGLTDAELTELTTL